MGGRGLPACLELCLSPSGTKRQLLAISSQLPCCTGQPGLGRAEATGRLAPQQQIHLGFDSERHFITKVNIGSKDSFWKRHPFM
ncbi:unnamed protein product [Caretta caretta]